MPNIRTVNHSVNFETLNLPESFRQRMQTLLDNSYQEFEQALQTEPPVSIRINKQTKFPAANPFMGLPQVAWCNNGYYLHKRPVFTLDPLLHAGAYYVQESASMFIEQCMATILQDENKPLIALDLCAAPGGKSTHLASLLPQGSLLVNNEVIRSRANILHENLMKWGLPNVIISNNDPHDFNSLHSFFDIILVDAPCSGEGMFRKDAGAINEWSEANVQLCAERQRRILADTWEALKPNGYLIYSTCTYNLEENENNVHWLMEEFDAVSIPIEYPTKLNISPSLVDGVHAARFFPHKTQSEGLFITLLQKPNNDKPFIRIKNEKPFYQKLNKDFSSIQNWLQPIQEWAFVQNNNSIFALPAEYVSTIELLNKRLRILSAGIPIAEIKGKDLVPNAALALSAVLDKNQFTQWHIDIETALNYLRRNNITCPSDMSKGYVLLVYKDIPLGWIKNLGNRSNNLYPQEWRIRHL